MRKAAHILIRAILAVAVLLSTIPMFHPDDANRDTRVDLADAIIYIKSLAATVDSADSFMGQAERVISTLHVLAGIKMSIGPAKDTKSKSSQFNPNCFFLAATSDSSFSLQFCSNVIEPFFVYRSNELDPRTRPPERV